MWLRDRRSAGTIEPEQREANGEHMGCEIVKVLIRRQ